MRIAQDTPTCVWAREEAAAGMMLAQRFRERAEWPPASIIAQPWKAYDGGLVHIVCCDGEAAHSRNHCITNRVK